MYRQTPQQNYAEGSKFEIFNKGCLPPSVVWLTVTTIVG